MRFEPFALEHYQSQFEHRVDFNLADSSVAGIGLSEWLDEAAVARLLDTHLAYPEVNGTARLREAIAALYPSARADEVLVTVGCAEANGLLCETLLEPGDEVIVMAPGYRQVWGLAQNAGCVVHEMPVDAEPPWRVDVDRLEALVARGPKLVSVTNPNNPTGTVLTADERARIIAACAQSGAWLHVDEVYCGTEIDGVDTASFWGNYDRLVCTNSLSKAYGLAGLRVGWTLAPREMVEALWRRHEYAVIATAGPSMTLAELALEPAMRARLLARQRQLSRDGRACLSQWVGAHATLVSWTPPPATSIGFVRYHVDRASYEVAEFLRERVSVLVAPGVALGREGYLRLTVGYPPAKVGPALDRVASGLGELAR